MKVVAEKRGWLTKLLLAFGIDEQVFAFVRFVSVISNYFSIALILLTLAFVERTGKLIVTQDARTTLNTVYAWCSWESLRYVIMILGLWTTRAVNPELIFPLLNFAIIPFVSSGSTAVSDWYFVKEAHLLRLMAAHILFIVIVTYSIRVRGRPLVQLTKTKTYTSLISMPIHAFAGLKLLKLQSVEVASRGAYSLMCSTYYSHRNTTSLESARVLHQFYVLNILLETVVSCIQVVSQPPEMSALSTLEQVRRSLPQYWGWWLNMSHTPLGSTYLLASLDCARSLLAASAHLFQMDTNMLSSLLLAPELMLVLSSLLRGPDKCYPPCLAVLNLPGTIAATWGVVECILHILFFWYTGEHRAPMATGSRNGSSSGEEAGNPGQTMLNAALYGSEVQGLYVNALGRIRLTTAFTPRAGWRAIYTSCRIYGLQWAFVRFFEIGALEVCADLRMRRVMGRGQFAVVFASRYRGVDVAVKRFELEDKDPVEQSELLCAFTQEVWLMRRLAHPNIVQLMGVSIKPLQIIMECAVTNLNDFLHSSNGPVRRGKVRMTQLRAVKLMAHVVSAMEFLHSHVPTILHMDLKTSNLLMYDTTTCKLGDFGISRCKHDYHQEHERVDNPNKLQLGTVQYTSPELLLSAWSSVTEKVDVYSFAIVLWEVLTAQRPWEDVLEVQIFYYVTVLKRRPEIPGSTAGWRRLHPRMRDLLERCWDEEPQNRPSFGQIGEELGNLGKAVREQEEAEAREEYEAARVSTPRKEKSFKGVDVEPKEEKRSKSRENSVENDDGVQVKAEKRSKPRGNSVEDDDGVGVKTDKPSKSQVNNVEDDDGVQLRAEKRSKHRANAVKDDDGDQARAEKRSKSRANGDKADDGVEVKTEKRSKSRANGDKADDGVEVKAEKRSKSRENRVQDDNGVEVRAEKRSKSRASEATLLDTIHSVEDGDGDSAAAVRSNKGKSHKEKKGTKEKREVKEHKQAKERKQSKEKKERKERKEKKESIHKSGKGRREEVDDTGDEDTETERSEQSDEGRAAWKAAERNFRKAEKNIQKTALPSSPLCMRLQSTSFRTDVSNMTADSLTSSGDIGSLFSPVPHDLAYYY